MSRLFDPITIGNTTLKNRIIFAPSSFGPGGAEWYEALAKGGCGMIVAADLSVVPSMFGGIALDSDASAAPLRKAIETCHQYGCRISAQLFHPEYDVIKIRELYRLEGRTNPQKVRAELALSTKTFCGTVSPEHIQDILDAYEAAARRAAALGFDMIQIHGDRLTGSFTSPNFNHRTDEWGDWDRFALEAVRAVRRGAPELPLDYKLTIRTEEPAYGRGGISMAQVPEFVRSLEEASIDCFHVSLANHTVTEDTIPPASHPYFQGEACFSFLARLVKKYTGKPVCCVGKIQSPETAEALCEEGIELIGMCRQLIADPQWPEKVRTGHTGEITHCLYCNKKCVGALKTGQAVGCVLHS